jgi:uncharacterized protein YneF (UPF0154 family)
MRLVFGSLLLFVVAAVLGQERFVSPGPSKSNSNPSISNSIHPIGSNLHVEWVGTNSSRRVSVVLFQYDGKNLTYPFEYLIRKCHLHPRNPCLFICLACSICDIFGYNMLRCSIEGRLGDTSYEWTVITNKNLTFSNLFLLNLFYDGNISPVAVSETFNITDPSIGSTTSTSSTSSATSTTSSVTSSTSGATNGTGSPDPSSSGDLSIGAKIGIGIGVPVVALLGIAVGYFLYRQQSKKQQYAAAPPAPEQTPPMTEQKLAEHVPGQMHEMGSLTPTYEMNGMSSGLHSTSTPSELCGDHTGHVYH